MSKDDNCVRARHDRGILRSGPFRRAVQDVLFAAAIVIAAILSPYYIWLRELAPPATGG